MKLQLTILALAASCAVLNAQLVTSLDNITHWAGNGTNRAALIIDFQDGKPKSSFAWGFEFDGTVTGAEMLTAVDAMDLNLSVTYSGTPESGFFVTSITYFDGTDSHTATNGNFLDNFDYWGYFVAGGFAGGTLTPPPPVYNPVASAGSLTLPSPWTESPSGAGAESFGAPGRFLADLSWDAWVFGLFGTPPSAVVYAAVPEPTLLTFLGLGSLLTVYAARKRIHSR